MPLLLHLLHHIKKELTIFFHLCICLIRYEYLGTHLSTDQFFRVSDFSGLEVRTPSGIIKIRVGFESGLPGSG